MKLKTKTLNQMKNGTSERKNHKIKGKINRKIWQVDESANFKPLQMIYLNALKKITDQIGTQMYIAVAS